MKEIFVYKGRLCVIIDNCGYISVLSKTYKKSYEVYPIQGDFCYCGDMISDILTEYPNWFYDSSLFEGKWFFGFKRRQVSLFENYIETFIKTKTKTKELTKKLVEKGI